MCVVYKDWEAKNSASNILFETEFHLSYSLFTLLCLPESKHEKNHCLHPLSLLNHGGFENYALKNVLVLHDQV